MTNTTTARPDFSDLLAAAVIELETLPEFEAPADAFEFEEDARWALDQLESGNEWGWCTVKVSARIQHPAHEWEALEGTAYLGACSYRGREDFLAGGYFEDMKQDALADLAAQLSALEARS